VWSAFFRNGADRTDSSIWDYSKTPICPWLRMPSIVAWTSTKFGSPLCPPSIRLSRLRVSDGPTSADKTFFRPAGPIAAQVLPLLRGRFEVTELILEKPVFNLMKQADGSFNYANMAGKKAPAGARRDTRKRVNESKNAESAPVPMIIPGRMSIHDGQLSIVSKGQSPVQIKGIDLSLEEFSGERPFPFRASFDYPGLKTISLEGELDYQENKSLLELKKNRLKIHNLNLPLQGSVSNLSTAPAQP
jgi:hypothetical protein